MINHSRIWKKIMRTSIIIYSLLLCMTQLLQAFPVKGQTLDKKVDVVFKTMLLQEAIDQIERTNNVLFAYNSKELDLQRNIPAKRFIDTRLDEVLRYLFAGTKVGFREDVSGTVTLFPLQQNGHLGGRVTDVNGNPVAGATVLIRELQRSTSTDNEGYFHVEVQPGTYTISVSFISYTSRIISGVVVKAGENTNSNVVLEEAQDQLQEVVVIGYGTNKKERVTGAITSIDEKEFQNYANANIDQVMVGKMAGVDILTNARNPGDANSIIIRGPGSITRGANPLIVVDGFPLAEGSSLNVLNPNDIQSIDVIKDAASSAIYGSRAANGLIMITTKNGRRRGPTVQLHSSMGVQERTGSYDLLNAYDAAVFFADGRNNAYLKNHADADINDTEAERLAKGANVRELLLGYTVPYLQNQPGLTDFNWEDAVYRAGRVQNHYLNIGGATDATNYTASIGYTDEEGVVITADQKRYTANFKLNTTINKHLEYGISVNGYYAKRGLTNSNNNYTFPIDPAGQAMVYMYPFFSAYDASNPTGYNIEAQIRANRPYNANMQENPVAMAELSKYESTEFNSFGSTYLAFTPIDNLTIKSSLGYLYGNTFTDHFAPMTVGAYRQLISERSDLQGFENRVQQVDFLWENTADYKFNFSKHNFSALLGQSFQSSKTSGVLVNGLNFPNDIIENIGGSTLQTASVSRNTWTQASYFGRLMYDYDNRYLFTGSVRTDGSSRFGTENRYGTFASFSAGWNVSNEAFFPKNKTLTFTKLRYSWGQTGNNQIGNYAQYATIGRDANYPYDGTLSPGAGPATAPAYGLTWETNVSNNIGIDLGFFNKVDLGVNYYIANISNLLLDRPVPTHTGYSQSLQNIGEMENKGWEFELSTSNLRLGDLGIGINANLSTNKNKILSLGGANEMYEDGNQRFITRVGEPLANLYGYKIIGLLKSQEEVDAYRQTTRTTLSAEVGDYIFQDTDGNGIIDANDRILFGDYSPEMTYGFGVSLSYKGFDMNVSFNGTVGRLAYDEMTSRYLEYGEAFTNTNYHYFNNYWDPQRNPDGFLAAPDAYGNTAARRASRNPTNYNVLDADYFRIRNLQLGYNLNPRLLERFRLQGLRIYVSVNNLHTFTKYRGMNPDGGDTGNPLNRGHVFGTTAVPRIISGGVNLSF